MLGTKFDLQRKSPETIRGRDRTLARAALGVSLSLLLAGVATIALFAAAARSPLQVSVEGASGELQPDTQITLSIPRVAVGVADVTLYESALGADGETLPERSIPVRLASATEGAALGMRAELQVLQIDGSHPLSYDGLYRLQITLNQTELAFPVLRDVLVAHDYTFSTLTTPRLHEPAGVVQMGYQKPLEILWSAPVEDFAVVTTPSVAAQAWVDPVDRKTGYVELIGADSGRQYEVLVTEARGTNGAPLLSAVALTVETAASPNPIAELATVENGNRIVVQWDRPVQSFDYDVSPAIASVAEIDPSDPQVSYIALQDPDQQQEYTVTITGGVGTSGAPINGMHEITVVTPSPLEIGKVTPGNRAYGVNPSTPIGIVFGEEVQNRAAAEAAITIAPEVPGEFEWPAANHVQFVPWDGDGLPHFTDITVAVAAGPEGARGVSGGYVETPFEFTFRTQPNKLINVDLTRQELTLYEDGQPVFTTSVATGVRFAETPTGDFLVDAKAPSTRMRGVNPSGSRYDIPNVPWVMSFLGDYAFHGAPWRSVFGYPQSNGCVSMSTAAAKYVYDWSPVGTPVKIHY